MTARQPLSPVDSAPPARRYEALKAAWKAANPDATPAEYQAAMIALAKKAGL